MRSIASNIRSQIGAPPERHRDAEVIRAERREVRIFNLNNLFNYLIYSLFLLHSMIWKKTKCLLSWDRSILSINNTRNICPTTTYYIEQSGKKISFCLERISSMNAVFQANTARLPSTSTSFEHVHCFATVMALSLNTSEQIKQWLTNARV